MIAMLRKQNKGIYDTIDGMIKAADENAQEKKCPVS